MTWQHTVSVFCFECLLIFSEKVCQLHGLRLLWRDVQRVDQFLDSLGGVLFGDVGEVCIDGCRRGAAMAKNALDMAKA